MIRKQDSMDDSVVETQHWHAVGGGIVQCDVCPRGCKGAKARCLSQLFSEHGGCLPMMHLV